MLDGGGAGGLSFQKPSRSLEHRCPRKGLEDRSGQPPKPGLAASVQDLELQVPSRALPVKPPYEVPDAVPSSPSPTTPFSPFPSTLPSLFRPQSRAPGLCLCKHPPPLQSGQDSEGRAGGPPSRLRSEGAARSSCDRRGQPGGQAPSPARSGHSDPRGEGRAATPAGTGPTPAGAGSGAARTAPRAGSQVTAPRGAGGGRGLGAFASLESGRAHITGAAAGRRRRAPWAAGPLPLSCCEGLLHEGAVRPGPRRAPAASLRCARPAPQAPR